MQKLNGFIKMYRKLLLWNWYTDCVIKSTFIHILLKAAYEETQCGGITLHKGQLKTTCKQFAAEIGCTVDQTRRALDKLKSTNEITIETTNKFSIITVVNWDDYQGGLENAPRKKQNKKTIKSQTNPKQQPNQIPNLLINKEKKNKRNKEEKEASPGPQIPEGFASREEYEAHIAELRNS